MAGVKLNPKCENVFLCACNKGDRYERWCELARTSASLITWTAHVQVYYNRLRREGRCDHLSIFDLKFVALALRDYYIQHVKE